MQCGIRWPFPHWRVAGGPWYPFGVPRLGLPLHSLCLGVCLTSIAVLCDSSSMDCACGWSGCCKNKVLLNRGRSIMDAQLLIFAELMNFRIKYRRHMRFPTYSLTKHEVSTDFRQKVGRTEKKKSLRPCLRLAGKLACHPKS